MDRFRFRYPEFSQVPDAKVQMALEDAQAVVSQKIWGKLYVQGIHALAAHYLYSNGGYAAAGKGSGQVIQPIASKSAGGLSVTYAGINQGLQAEFGSYSATAYGQRYLELRNLVGVHILVVP